ncbi:MAG: hypothetical protein K9J42_11940, partial [Sulfuritalea sp.]|nr:hypothetical protein [Sulfuritalea sp.]
HKQEAGKFPESSHETGPLSNENDIAVTISSRFQFAAVFCGGLFSDSLAFVVMYFGLFIVERPYSGWRSLSAGARPIFTQIRMVDRRPSKLTGHCRATIADFLPDARNETLPPVAEKRFSG